MATAKLWLNPSGNWVTSDTVYSSKSTPEGAVARASVSERIIAYDDYSIKIVFGFAYWAVAPGGVWLDKNSLTVSSDSSTLYAGSLADGRTVSLTGKSQVKWNWTVKPCAGSSYGPETSDNQTVNYASPFYTVTYNANGGSDAPTSTSGIKNYTSTLSADTPTRSNHTFLGWATSSSAHTADYSAGSTLPAQTADITLYAVWQPTVFITADEGATITFDGVDYTNTSTSVGKTWGNEYALTIAPNTGFIIKYQSHANGDITLDGDTLDENMEVTISATSQRVGCHIDDGEDFVQAVMYVDNGVSYDMVQAYVDNGVTWDLVY